MKLNDDQKVILEDLKSAFALAKKIYGGDRPTPEQVFAVHVRVYAQHEDAPKREQEDLQAETAAALELSAEISREIFGGVTVDTLHGQDAPGIFGIFFRDLEIIDDDGFEEYEEEPAPPPKRKPKSTTHLKSTPDRD